VRFVSGSGEVCLISRMEAIAAPPAAQAIDYATRHNLTKQTSFDPLLTPEHVRQWLGYEHVGSIRRLFQRGVLPGVKIGDTHTLRFRREDLEAFIAAGFVAPGKKPNIAPVGRDSSMDTEAVSLAGCTVTPKQDGLQRRSAGATLRQ
jgi:hypothetical protein